MSGNNNNGSKSRALGVVMSVLLAILLTAIVFLTIKNV